MWKQLKLDELKQSMVKMKDRILSKANDLNKLGTQLFELSQWVTGPSIRQGLNGGSSLINNNVIKNSEVALETQVREYIDVDPDLRHHMSERQILNALGYASLPHPFRGGLEQIINQVKTKHCWESGYS